MFSVCCFNSTRAQAAQHEDIAVLKSPGPRIAESCFTSSSSSLEKVGPSIPLPFTSPSRSSAKGEPFRDCSLERLLLRGLALSLPEDACRQQQQIGGRQAAAILCLPLHLICSRS